MDFKAMVKADNAVFLNAAEFAETHNVRYDGEIYEEISVVMVQLKESDRTVVSTDHSEGIYKVSAKVYIAQSDMDGVFPEKGRSIEIDNGEAVGKAFYDKYTIVTSSIEMGMIVLELERYDE